MNELPAVYLPETESSENAVTKFLENHGIAYRDRSGATAEEIAQETGIPESEASGQSPIVKWTDGTVLKSCDTDRLIRFLREQGYEFEDS